MNKKTHPPGPVPSGNRPHAGGGYEPPEQDDSGRNDAPQDETGPDQDQDEKRGLGQFTGTGEPPRQQ